MVKGEVTGGKWSEPSIWRPEMKYTFLKRNGGYIQQKSPAKLIDKGLTDSSFCVLSFLPEGNFDILHDIFSFGIRQYRLKMFILSSFFEMFGKHHS